MFAQYRARRRKEMIGVFVGGLVTEQTSPILSRQRSCSKGNREREQTKVLQQREQREVLQHRMLHRHPM